MKLSYEKKRILAGWLFVLPWIIGAAFFFLWPLVTTIYYSFVQVSINTGSGGLLIRPLPSGVFENYIYAFTKDTNYLWYYQNVLAPMLYSIPAILVFSLFIANILSKPFHGRVFMRAVFFLPVIITSGVVVSIMKNNLSTTSLVEAAGSMNIFDTGQIMDFLFNMGLPQTIVDFLGALIGNIMDLVWKSGVQILIFMAGIMAIPPSYYEVCAVEGATAWECFWKVTFPLIIPHIMINLIYSMVEMLSSYDNQLMKYIIDTIFTNVKFSYGSALAWIYFVVISAFIGLLLWIVSRINKKYVS
ncbi:MAG: sugar ABC transporter permease [Clostridiales bacterium]|nr:sugar ABC transporter permease [Clostridiales bacterium]